MSLKLGWLLLRGLGLRRLVRDIPGEDTVELTLIISLFVNLVVLSVLIL